MHLTRHSKAEGATYRITTARKSVADDQAIRVRGYVISMSIRIGCFVLACMTYFWLDWPALAWVLVLGALVIPYLAVVYANGGREPNEDPPAALGTFGQDRRELPPGPSGR